MRLPPTVWLQPLQRTPVRAGVRHRGTEWPVEGYLIEIEGEAAVRCSLKPLGGRLDGATTTATQ
jgi:hypothetical protein